MSIFGESRSKTVRAPAVAGKFYPSRRSDCMDLIESSFRNEFGPGSIPEVSENRTASVLGVVVPHAGWIYSGPIAANSYAEIAEDGFPETLIIIGPNHTGIGQKVAVSTMDFKTPLGIVKTDRQLLAALDESIITQDDDAHALEHSIEVQIPFLQYFGKPFKILAICLGARKNETFRKAGKALADAIKETDRDTVIVASSDFTHAGMYYSDPVPEGMQPGDYAMKRDKAPIKKIVDLDPSGLVKVVQENGITMCGFGPVATMLYAAKEMGASTAELLKYSTSQHIRHEKYSDIAVGYGSLVVRRA